MNKEILDACCGGKMFYFDKHDDRVLFQDIRDIETNLCDGRKFVVKPDVQADFTDMPYPDESFSMVVFDPPHLKYTGSKKEKNGFQMVKSPDSYPDSDRSGITAPYCGMYYHDGVRFKDDDDTDTFRICDSEEEFKELVLELIEKL